MLPYEQQLKYKQQQVTDNLIRIGKIPLPEIMPIIGTDQTTRYRNKIEYTFANKRFLLQEELHNPLISAEENVAGYHARGYFDKVVPIIECHLQAEPTNFLRLAIWDYARQHQLTHYDIRNHTGYLRNLLIRMTTTGEIMVNIVVGYDDEKLLFPMLEFVQNKFPEITTLLYTINTKKNDSLFDLEPQVFSGKGYVTETLENFKFKISPKSFFQTNSYQGEKLYQVTREFAELSGTETVYDLYCGTGSIGIFVSKLAKKIVGVEMVEDAIEDAKGKRDFEWAAKCCFFCGRCNRHL